MIKIALVDDHVVLRKSLAILIEMFKNFKITIQADISHRLSLINTYLYPGNE